VFKPEKPTCAPGFWSLFLQGEFKLWFWTQQVETDRFFTAGSTAVEADRKLTSGDAVIYGIGK
jgi:hypothetical protein